MQPRSATRRSYSVAAGALNREKKADKGIVGHGEDGYGRSGYGRNDTGATPNLDLYTGGLGDWGTGGRELKSPRPDQ